MAYDDSGERIVLRKVAELVTESDKRRRILENIDRIAQGALDHVRSYTNKKGDEVTVEQPDWNVAIKCMESATQLLGLDATETTGTQQAGQQGAVARILAAVPGKAQSG
jgi:hypothetical protein